MPSTFARYASRIITTAVALSLLLASHSPSAQAAGDPGQGSSLPAPTYENTEGGLWIDKNLYGNAHHACNYWESYWLVVPYPNYDTVMCDSQDNEAVYLSFEHEFLVQTAEELIQQQMGTPVSYAVVYSPSIKPKRQTADCQTELDDLPVVEIHDNQYIYVPSELDPVSMIWAQVRYTYINSSGVTTESHWCASAYIYTLGIA